MALAVWYRDQRPGALSTSRILEVKVFAPAVHGATRQAWELPKGAFATRSSFRMWAQSQILATLRNMHMSCKYHSLSWMISCMAPLIDFVELVWVPHTPRVAVKYISWQVECFRWRRCPKRCLLKGPSTVLHLWTSTPVPCCSATHQICAHPVQVWNLNAELIYIQE